MEMFNRILHEASLRNENSTLYNLNTLGILGPIYGVHRLTEHNKETYEH